MACLDFDPNDYVDDIDTDVLKKELARRVHPIQNEYAYHQIKEALNDAWEQQDQVAFEKAVLMIEPPDLAERRAFRIREAYQAAMANNQATH